MLKGNQYKKLITVVLILAVIWLGLEIIQGNLTFQSNEEVTSFEEKTDLIRIDNPRPGQEISSPLEITGKARGYWFFEASFPLELQDSEGNIIIEHYAEAVLDPNNPDLTWMTEDFIPFESSIEFDSSKLESGNLILRRSNPSGLPENDDKLIIPVIFN
ncbi:MAG: Gmad2 immunoglobulin-like domain-containing protein [Candidatus Paceibacterota bacterium]